MNFTVCPAHMENIEKLQTLILANLVTKRVVSFYLSIILIYLSIVKYTYIHVTKYVYKMELYLSKLTQNARNSTGVVLLA